MSDYHYSILLDSFIGAGAALTYGNASQKELISFLESSISENPKEFQNFPQAMGLLEEDVRSGMEDIQSKDVIRLSPSPYFSDGSSIWPEDISEEAKLRCQQGALVHRTLLLFDLVAYLYTTFADISVDLKDGAAEEMYRSVSDKVKTLYEQVTEKADLLWPRLIPYNNIRREHANNLPEQIHYFHPWHTIEATLPEESFEHIVAELLAQEAEPQQVNGKSSELLQEITDTDLINAIQQEVKQQKEFIEIVAEALTIPDAASLRFLLAADKQARHTPMPETVKQVGRIRCILFLFLKDCASAGVTFAKFRAAFCGYAMSRELRISWLELDRATIQDNKNHPLWFAKCISHWQLEDLKSDKKFAETMFHYWVEDIELVANTNYLQTFLPRIPDLSWEYLGDNMGKIALYAQAFFAAPGTIVNLWSSTYIHHFFKLFGLASTGTELSSPGLAFERSYSLSEATERTDEEQRFKDYSDPIQPLPDIYYDEDGFSGPGEKRLSLLAKTNDQSSDLGTLRQELENSRFAWKAHCHLASGKTMIFDENRGKIPIVLPMDDLQDDDGIEMVFLAIARQFEDLDNIFEKPCEMKAILKIFVKEKPSNE